MQVLDQCLDAFLDGPRNLVTRQCETKIVRRPLQNLLQNAHGVIVDLVQTQVEMLELWALEQEVIDDLIPIRVCACLSLQTVQDGDWLLRLLLLSQLLVLLYDGVSLLQLGLVSFHLLSWEWNLAKGGQQWCDVIRSQIVLG